MLNYHQRDERERERERESQIKEKNEFKWKGVKSMMGHDDHGY